MHKLLICMSEHFKCVQFIYSCVTITISKLVNIPISSKISLLPLKTLPFPCPSPLAVSHLLPINIDQLVFSQVSCKWSHTYLPLALALPLSTVVKSHSHAVCCDSGFTGGGQLTHSPSMDVWSFPVWANEAALNVFVLALVWVCAFVF